MIEREDTAEKSERRKRCEHLADLLMSGKSVLIEPSGHSMEPLIRGGKDRVVIRSVDRPPVPGDILLWWRWDDTLILHRLLLEDGDRYYLRGDNTTKTNRARKDRIIGVVSYIYRNGRWFPVTGRRYRTYVRFLMVSPSMRRSMRDLKEKTGQVSG